MRAAERSSGRRTDLTALAVYAALACLLFLPALRAPQSRIVGYPGDAQQTMWFLRWVPWAIGHATDPLLTKYLNHPGGVNLMWNSLAPALGVVLWPVSATAGLVASYDVLLTAEVALSAWCAHLAIRRFVDSGVAAAAGGLVYGFSPYLLTHAHGHAKVAFALLPPLLLIALHEALAVQRRRPRTVGIAVGVLVTLQLLVYEEGVVLAVIAAAVGTAVLALLHRDRVRTHAAHAARALVWAVAAFAVLSAAPLAVQLLGPNRINATVPGTDVYVTDVANLAVPTGFQAVAPALAERLAARFSGNETENGSYLGLPLLALLALAALRLRARPVVRWALWSGGGLLLLSMGPQLHVGGHVSRLPLPWRAVQAIPVVSGALPARLFVYVVLAAALLVAVVVADALRAPLRRPHAALVAGLCALTAVALLPELPFPSTAIGVPDFFRGGGVAALPQGSVALVAPFSHDGPTDTPMLWQAEARMRFAMPEGYFVGVRPGGIRADGPRPSATGSVMIDIQGGRGAPALTPPLRSRLIGELRRWQVRTVLVGPMANEDGMASFVTSLLHRSPRRVGGVWVWSLE